MTQLAIVENPQILSTYQQIELRPMEISCLEILNDGERTAIFHKGFCCGSFDSEDKFSRNYFLVQLHLSGGLKLKDLSQKFGLQYQHCSTIVVNYRREGLEGIKETPNLGGHRLLITPKIAELILKLRGEKKSYDEISKIIRFKFKKKIEVTTMMTWVCKEKKRLEREVKWEQQEMPIIDEVYLDLIPVVAKQAEIVNAVEGNENWNSYAGSLILYAMLYRSRFLENFERNIL